MNNELELTIAAHLLWRLARADKNRAIATGLEKDLARRGMPGYDLALMGADPKGLKNAVRNAGSMVSTAAGIPLVVNPASDEPLPAGASIVIVDVEGMDGAMAKEVLSVAGAIGKTNRAVVCYVDPMPFPAGERSARCQSETTLTVALNPGPDDTPSPSGYFVVASPNAPIPKVKPRTLRW